MNKKLSRSIIYAITLLIVITILPLYALKVSQKLDYTDFDVYYLAAMRAKAHQWGQIYNLADGSSPMRYAPPLILLFRPFAELGLHPARLCWYFLQYFWFGLGFYFIYLSVQRIHSGRKNALLITCISILSIVRFCLDTFMIGQIASLLFLGFSIALYAWLSRRTWLVGLALFFPAFFKIGPAVALGPTFLASRFRQRWKLIAAPLIGLGTMTALSTLWIGSWERMKALFVSWIHIVELDSVYYDSSHYGSQSLNSALLRLAKSGWISLQMAERLDFWIVCGGTLALIGFWSLRKPKNLYGRALFFSLSLFAYMGFMPETFKYSLTPLGICVAVLLCAREMSSFTWFSLGFGAVMLSLAGKDIVGDWLFFSMQRASLPFLAVFFLGIATLREALKESKPRIQEKRAHPWDRLPEALPSMSVSVLVALPMDQASRVLPETFRQTLESLDIQLKSHWSRKYEILLIPYGDRVSLNHPLLLEARSWTRTHTESRLLQSPKQEGRGIALQEGFLASHGENILIAPVDQPCDPEFYLKALAKLSEEYQLVRGNRRSAETRFKIPVRLLSLVYGRHRLGLLFNRLIRRILPIETTDTQSGILAMKRSLALEIFSLQSSADFLFDLEIPMICKKNQAKVIDLPVTLFLAQEKSKRRMGRETLQILLGLPRLALRYRLGFYEQAPHTKAISADDWGLSPEINAGILKLAQLGVVKRVSLMANCEYLENGLQELVAIPGVELSLHFNLTYGIAQPFGHHGPAHLLLRWMNPLKNRQKTIENVRAEFKSQHGKLARLGLSIHSMDGHHHIHVIPGLINSIADLMTEAKIKRVRVPYDPALWLSSKAPLAFFAWVTKKSIRAHGFESLDCYYPKISIFQDQGLLRKKLSQNLESEIIVHPARSNDLATLQFSDPYTEGRVLEFRALQMLAPQGGRLP